MTPENSSPADAADQGRTPTALTANVVDRLVDSVVRAVIVLPRWVFQLVLFLATTAYCVWLAFELFDGIPRIDDSVAAVYQARLFAEGALTWPVNEALVPWFDLFGIISPIDAPDRWTSMYPPGTALLFTPALLFDATWIVIPLCGGLLVVAIVSLGCELFDESTGRIAGLLAAVSPFLTAVSATHLSHTPSAVLVTLGWLFTLRLLRSGAMKYAAGAGASIGLCILFRQETALLVGGVIALCVLVNFHRALELWRHMLVAAAIAFLGVVALTGWQYAAIGKAGQSGHEIEMGKSSKLGVNVTVHKHYRFTRPKANNHAIGRARAVLDNVVAWPVPVEFLLLAPLVLGAAVWRSLWLMLPFGVLSALFYHFWYWEEWLPGRYLFPAVPMLLILAAWGVVSIRRSFAAVPVLRSLPALLLALGCVWSLTVGGPEYRTFFKPHHADVEDWLPRIIKDNEISNALVFVARESTLKGATYNDYYTTAFRLNSLDLDGDIVYARDGFDRDLQIDNNILISHYPGRDYYLYTYNQRNRRGRIEKLNVENGRVTGSTPMPWLGTQLR